MKHRVSVINKSNGKFTIETINKRDHLVTSMMVIEGDSVMNGLFYPNAIVTNAIHQLDMLPAPDGHPSVDGDPISAYHPLAVNAHNFGGFTRSPTSNGKKNFTDLVIDLEVANKSERGKKIINKIKSGKRIGVSTGLIAEVSNANGKVGGNEYNGQVDYINFDHVAVLLDAMPAGENTYTINHDGFKPKSRGMFMDKLELDLSPLAVQDRVKLSSLTVNELVNHVNHEITVEEATVIINSAGLHVNKVSKNDIDCFISNKKDFATFIKAKEDEVSEIKEFITENSKMTIEQLSNMDIEQLNALSQSVAPKNTYVAPNGQRKSNSLELLDDETGE